MVWKRKWLPMMVALICAMLVTPLSAGDCCSKVVVEVKTECCCQEAEQVCDCDPCLCVDCKCRITPVRTVLAATKDRVKDALCRLKAARQARKACTVQQVCCVTVVQNTTVQTIQAAPAASLPTPAPPQPSDQSMKQGIKSKSVFVHQLTKHRNRTPL